MKKVLRLAKVSSRVLSVLNDMGYEVMFVTPKDKTPEKLLNKLTAELPNPRG